MGEVEEMAPSQATPPLAVVKREPQSPEPQSPEPRSPHPRSPQPQSSQPRSPPVASTQATSGSIASQKPPAPLLPPSVRASKRKAPVQGPRVEGTAGAPFWHECPHCPETCTSEEELQAHLQHHSVTSEPPTTTAESPPCPPPTMVADVRPSSGGRDSAAEVADQRFPFPCHLCRQVFESRALLERHLRGHPMVIVYKCRYCPNTFSTTRLLLQHVLPAHRPANPPVPLLPHPLHQQAAAGRTPDQARQRFLMLSKGAAQERPLGHSPACVLVENGPCNWLVWRLPR
ncbi:uncharacterized protein LOC144158337 [Haemaphysalis longicornis]